MKPWVALAWITSTTLAAIWVWPRPSELRVVPVAAVARTPVADPARTPAPRSLQRATPRRSYPNPWRALEAGDLSAFVAGLREAGCPEPTVRVFGLAALGRSYQQRIEAPYRNAVRTSRYWQPNPWMVSGVQAEDLGQTMRRSQRELDRELSRLLGVPATLLRDGFEPFPPDPVLTALEPESRDRLFELLHRQEIEREELEATLTKDALGKFSDSESRAAIRAQRERHRTEVASVLGPEEAERRELRDSPEAHYVRQVLPEARSEQDFRRMVQAARDVGVQSDDILEHQLSRHGGTNPLATNPPIRDQVLQRYRALNTPERVAELESDLALDEATTRAQEEARREAASLDSLQAAAREVGVELSDLEVRELAEALKRRAAALEGELGQPPKNPSPAEEAALRERLQKELEAASVSVLGERGRGIARGLIPGK